MNQDLKDQRRDYSWGHLKKSSLNSNPIIQLRTWLSDAIEHCQLDANAMTLSTVKSNGSPSSRIVLLKEILDDGIVFYTNYNSRKGREIQNNKQVALNFYWKDVERQVRIEGSAEKVSYEESEQYFHSRPYGSQVGAISSNQSSLIIEREEIELRYQDNFAKYEKEGRVPMPAHWGGYIVRPRLFEFWQGRDNRLHDRLEYNLDKGGKWLITRLEP